jgi:hypothetical protein
MTALTVQAALAIALKCLPPAIAPIMVGIAQHESGLEPAAVHHNANGTADVGIVQVNTANFAWTGLTWQTALRPCANLRAGAMVLLARYNGNPPPMLKAAYAHDVLNRLRHLADTAPVQAAPAVSAQSAPASIFGRPDSQQALVIPPPS